ncbi:MAG: hypothetical protein BRD40_04650 [Bacteroidetes bacterium QS_1_65_9]|nr:MAG: hypothetical protein BRD40_04650 [Bacteroidetes bacterium QS_1_65_9]
MEDARFLLADSRIRTGSAQVYFAVYYACRALLEEGFYFERHASVTGNVVRVSRYREWLDTSFPAAMQYRREQCEYELFKPGLDDADQWAWNAARFIERAETLL